MKDIYAALKKCAGEGEATVLVSVAEKSGSAPRGAGACMLVFQSGAFLGSVGGGELEYEALCHCRELFEKGGSQTIKYALGIGGGLNTGMVCGGEVTLCYRHVAPGDREALSWCAGRLEKSRALIYGAGHVAAALCPVLRSVGFECTVHDDRENLLTPERFPQGTALCRVDMDAAEIQAGEDDFIVIMTHGHAHDFALLSRALLTPARYIGVIGSRKKAAMARERLKAEGFGDEDIRRVHSPVGLSIGAETPAEIAVSIAAEMIAARKGQSAHRRGL